MGKNQEIGELVLKIDGTASGEVEARDLETSMGRYLSFDGGDRALHISYGDMGELCHLIPVARVQMSLAPTLA